MPDCWKNIRNLFQTTPALGEALLSPAVQSERMVGLFASGTLAEFFSRIFYTALAIGAILAVLRLGYAGFMYMTSDVWGNKQKAKGIIQEAVLGLLLLLAVWLILNQINPEILNLDVLRSVQQNDAGGGAFQ